MGKGTQCNLLKNTFGPRVSHFSAGELLRQKANSSGEEGQILRDILSDGGIIPAEVTLELLADAIHSTESSVVLIDGFPRCIDQAVQFEEEISPCEFTLYFDAPVSLLKNRLVQREEQHRTLGIQRSDDNESCRLKVSYYFVWMGDNCWNNIRANIRVAI